MIKRFFLIIWLFLLLSIILGQSVPGEYPQYVNVKDDSLLSGQNELTIYVIPSTVKYDWSSPHSLFKSYFKNYKRNLFKRRSYCLGHAFIELHTPLASKRILTGMRAASRKEQKDLVFKQHYGLAILGADTKGVLESETDLDYNVKEYSRKGQLAFMTIFISDEATERMIQFFQSYKAGIDSNGSPGARYGGAFWPRYEGEGAGCSAFAVSFLDLAGLLKEEFDKWLVKVNIPMDLIGGPYNNYQDVRLRDIKKQKTWTENNTSEGMKYELLEMYDPTLMYEWIKESRDKQEVGDAMTVTPVQLNEAIGIRIDGRNLPLPEEESIFLEREKPSIFIDYYRQKYKIEN